MELKGYSVDGVLEISSAMGMLVYIIDIWMRVIGLKF